MEQYLKDEIQKIVFNMTREDRIDLIFQCLVIESDLNFNEAKFMTEGFLKYKKIRENGRGLLGTSARRQTKGIGFELVWLHLEKGWKKSFGRKPKIKRIPKPRSQDRYTLSSVEYNGIEEWEIELFEMIEKKAEPLRKLMKIIGKISRLSHDYKNICQKYEI